MRVVASIPQSTNGGEYLFVEPPLVFVGRWGSGIRVFDFSIPAVPRFICEMQEEYAAAAASAHGSVICSVGRMYGEVHADTGLNVIDISEAAAPKIIGIASLDGLTPRTVCLTRDFAYAVVLAGESTQNDGMRFTARLYVFDICDKRHPRRRSTLDIDGDPFSVSSDGNYVYLVARLTTMHLDAIATSRELLRIIDVRNPDAVKEVSSIEMDAWNSDVTIDGRSIYTTSRDRLRVFDVSRGAKPRLSAEVRLGLQCGSLVALRNRVYVDRATKSDGSRICVVDTSRPQHPRLLGEGVIQPGKCPLGPESAAISDEFLVHLGENELRCVQVLSQSGER
ncbi:MAG: hypothetical protein HUU46_22810 [Candidatus Hydrogenedentes bacterium]|nr:hypothetical protein [Candidatus Hydrogenedentota bacterium]